MQRSESFLPENDLKIVVLGQSCVGKSSVTARFVHGAFSDDYVPTLQEVHRKGLIIDNKPVNLEVLDTAGADEYVMMQENWIQQGKGFILIYSITSMDSFEELKKIKKRIDRIKEFKETSIIVLGNKCDLKNNREVDTEKGKALAEEFKALFMETSAKTGTNCEEAFIALVRDIRQKEVPIKKEKKDKGFFQKLFSACNLI